MKKRTYIFKPELKCGNHRRSQRGIGIIEILIAVLIISFGFLASAQMQVQGMRFNQSAYFKSQANMMLKDITDRMRGNRAGVTAGGYSNQTTSANRTMPTCVSSETPCTPAELASKDLAEMSAYLHSPAGTSNLLPLLPGTTVNPAQLSIVPSGGIYTISVQWNERIKGTDTLQQLTVQFTQ